LSGITVTRVQVVSAAERARRERAAAYEAYAVARTELAALQAEAETYRSVYGKAVTAVPAVAALRPSSSARKLQAATEQAGQLIRRHRPMLAGQVASAARAQTSGLAAAAPRAAPPPAAAPRPAPAPPAARPARTVATRRGKGREPVGADPAPEQQDPEAWREKVSGRAAELLARLPARAGDATRIACERVVLEIGTAGEHRARMLLRDLESKVQKATAEQERAAAVRRELAVLSARLEAAAEVPAEEARELAAAVQRAMAAAEPYVPPGLPDRVAAAVDAAEREHRRKVIAAAVSVSLGELGYAVAEGFETVLADDGVAYAGLPAADGYGVKFLLDRDDRTVRTQVVRTAENGAAADTTAERSFCAGLPDLRDRLRRNGVESAEPATVEPGRVPVQQVAAAVVPQAAETWQQHYRERQQEA
jgi:hypothetical protein